VSRDLIPGAPAQGRFANAVYALGGASHSETRGEILPVHPRPSPGPAQSPQAPASPLPAPPPAITGLVPVAFRTGRTLLRWAGRLLPEDE
jgi:hypothetical protein